jgi:hypothetical protein
MESIHRPETFIPLKRAAHRLGVPASWLRTEAEANRLPHLTVGRRLLFNVELVERELIARASDAKVAGGLT